MTTGEPGMLASGFRREMQKDSIERSIAEGELSFRDIDPNQDVRMARQFRGLAMRLAQELPHDEGTANAILDHARDLARQIRSGFTYRP